jgi:hypothetical protein
MFRKEYRHEKAWPEPYRATWVEAFAPETGTISWQTPVAHDPPAPTNARHFGTYGDRVVVPVEGGRGYAIEYGDREVDYRIDLENSDDSPTDSFLKSFVFGSDRILVRHTTSDGLRLTSLDPATGSVQWQISPSQGRGS